MIKFKSTANNACLCSMRVRVQRCGSLIRAFLQFYKRIQTTKRYQNKFFILLVQYFIKHRYFTNKNQN